MGNPGSIEYWISRGGQLREWVRQNIQALAWLLIPELLIAPVVGIILRQVLKWTELLSNLTHHLFVLSFLGFLVLLVVSVLLSIIRGVFR